MLTCMLCHLLLQGEERMICHFYRDNWPCKVRLLFQRRADLPCWSSVYVISDTGTGKVLLGCC